MSAHKDAPAFDFYPERWLVGTASLTDAEQLSYLRLLCHQWTMDGLPEDVTVLRRLAGKGVTGNVINKFPCVGGKRRNQMLESVRESQRERIRKSRDKIDKMNSARASTRGSTRTSTRPLLSGLLTASSPLTTHPIESHSANEPLGGREGSTEIPPVSLETAKANSGMYGATSEIAEKWWLDQDARAWTDRSGQPIRKWESSLRSYAIQWRANASRGSGRGRPEEQVSHAPNPNTEYGF